MSDAEPAARPFSPVLARDGDPETSHDAARSVVEDGTVETHERRILEALRWMPRGGTASEIAVWVRDRYGIEREIEFCKHTVCRRLYGLVAAGLLFRRLDPKRPGKYQRRNGETLHWLNSGDAPLFGE
ncbi:MAG TPA: hypothetical protein P5118_23315 [Planctomycetota bacterium]|nr:hypothetical protein [Planctomycetota bacterium]